MNNERGTLFVISAPSGCGKGTILEEVFKRVNNLFFSVSATTRSPRPGEIDGVNYYFKTVDEFKEMVDNDGVLEYAQFCGNYYGTPKAAVLEKLSQGIDVVLEIETQGAMSIKKSYPEAVLIFILPPSVKELERRLKNRGTETDEVIAKRVGEASGEINKAYNYDFVLVNDELELAIENFIHILKSHRFKINNNKNTIDEVLKNA